MTRWMLVTALVVLAVLSLGCRRESSGFELPPGDVAAGQAAFLDLGCTSCHRVDGVEFPNPAAEPAVLLGGRVAVVPTAGELTTSIIHPSATLVTRRSADAIRFDLRPRMPDMTTTMTVSQMSDLVAFLHSRYERVPMPPPIK